MITIDGKTYRTLPEQVEENARNIASIENNIDVLETAIGGAIITTEQLDERIDALDNELIQGLADIDLEIIDINARIDAVDEKADTNAEDIVDLQTRNANLQGSISELRNTVNGSAQYLIETMEDVAELKGKVYNPISSNTIIADKDDVNKEVSFNIAADITAKIDNSLQTPRSSPASTILVGVDSTRSQCNVTVGAGLVIENDTLKATLTSDAVRAIVDEELGVIVNGRY